MYDKAHRSTPTALISGPSEWSSCRSTLADVKNASVTTIVVGIYDDFLAVRTSSLQI